MLQVINRFHAARIGSVREVVNLNVNRRNDLLEMDAQKMCVNMLHD
jgi:hypothetical protein